MHKVFHNKLTTNKVQIMGILNVTPDSFYDGGDYLSLTDAVKHAEDMINDGVDIIDVGGVSTKPFSIEPPEDVEKQRVIPVIKEIRKNFDIPISIDTYRPSIAKEALDNGADVINNVRGISYSDEMVKVAVEFDVPLIIMHMKGSPKTMQENPFYNDVIAEIKSYFDKEVSFAIERGVKKENIIIDPGIGFGKRLEDNISIIKNILSFVELGYPILLGLSRKSFIEKLVPNTKVEDRLISSVIFGFISVLNGVNIIRVHDVKETSQMLKIHHTMYGTLKLKDVSELI